MKVSVSIRDELHQQSEQLARDLGLNRDELYNRALQRYIQAQEDAQVTQGLNLVYADEDSSLEPELAKMQSASLEPEK